MVYAQLGLYQKSEEELRKALAIGHEAFMPFLNLANTLQAQGKYDEVEAVLKRARERKGRKCPCRNGYTAWGSAQWSLGRRVEPRFITLGADSVREGFLKRTIPVGICNFLDCRFGFLHRSRLTVTSYTLRSGMEGTNHSANADRDSWRCLIRGILLTETMCHRCKRRTNG